MTWLILIVVVPFFLAIVAAYVVLKVAALLLRIAFAPLALRH